MFLSAFFSPKSEPDKQLAGYLKEYFGFSPFHLQLYRQALIHKSVTKNRTAGIRHSNERLEFLGDAILDALIGDYLYRKYPDEHEGVLSKARSKLVSREHLMHLAKSTGLEHLVVCDINDQSVKINLAGNAMEALIGAMFLKKGYHFTKTRILILIERFTDVDEFLAKDEDYKSLLYQWAQKNKKMLEYRAEELKADQLFEVSLFIDQKFIAKAKASNKKKAEKEVSKTAIGLLKLKV